MLRAAEFQPDWANPPGTTISTILKSKGLSLEQLVLQSRYTMNFWNELIAGTAEVTAACAELLEMHLGPPASFWLAREHQYRNNLARKAMVTTTLSISEFVGRFPIAEMNKAGWIAKSSTAVEKMAAVLGFFGVGTISEWQDKFGNAASVAAFRTSPSIDANPFAVAAWLRRAELEGSRIHCLRWNRVLLEQRLPDMRALVRVKDPAVFLPRLKEICSSCGVALVVEKAPKGCRASGATRFLTPEKALIVMSFRHKTDDQFWFTFFHEVGHLLLHGGDALFLEDGSEVTEEEETEANLFSANVLVPPQFQQELANLRCSMKSIVAFARRVEIAPGVVVGQLQHLGRIKFDRMNSMKRRYHWSHDGVPTLIP